MAQRLNAFVLPFDAVIVISMKHGLRAFSLCFFLSRAAWAADVAMLPRVEAPLGANAREGVQIVAPPVLPGAGLISDGLAPIADLPSAAAPNAAPDFQHVEDLATPAERARLASAGTARESDAGFAPETDVEQVAESGAARFDRAALRDGRFNAVAGPDISGDVSVNQQGVWVSLAPGHSMKMAVVAGRRRDGFIVWKDAEGYRIRREGAGASRALPAKGLFIFRGPVSGRESADRMTIPDADYSQPKLQAVLSVDAGAVVVNEMGRWSMLEQASVLISGARAEGPFPIQSVLTASGHGFDRGSVRYLDETVLVDWDKDAALRAFYERVKRLLARRGVKDDELAALSAVFDAVAAAVKYDAEAINRRVAELGGRRGVLLGELMGLSGEESCSAVGVCRHMALLLGAVLERLIHEGAYGLAGGKVYYVGGKGHAWAVYRDSREAFQVLDAAQQKRPVPLEPHMSYEGTLLEHKGKFNYSLAMAPELDQVQ